MKIGVKVSDAMTRSPVVVSKNTPLPQCARKMLSNNVGALIIKEGKKLIGIITEKDIVEGAVAKELNVKKTLAKDIMTTGMITIAPEADLYKAVELMNRENVRRLPVVKNGDLIGLLTVRDLLYAQPKLYQKVHEYLVSKRVKK